MMKKDSLQIKASLEPAQISRRGLFRGLISGTKANGIALTVETFKRECARPPTCVDETLLDELCDGCGKCERACEQKVLRLVEGKPQLHLDCNYCTDCQMCQSACKTGALSNTTTSTGVIPLFGDNCQRLFFGQCEICSSHCLNDAIDITDKKPTITQELCNGCGECRTYCPMNAISFQITNIPQP